jgi:hypothetical protein
MKKQKRRRRRKGLALVHAHLEHVSRGLLEKHFDIVRQSIGRNKGVYALYRKKRLYYIGLATRLSWRLRDHVKDRHGLSWDNFSIYLTINDRHIKELEALLLRIAHPSGNKQTGTPAGSQNIRRSIMGAIRRKQDEEVSTLFDRRPSSREVTSRKAAPAHDPVLLRLLLRGGRLRGVNKGKIHHARARKNGTVRFNGHSYSSLSSAAQAAMKRPTNGWWFWQVERGKRNWVRMRVIRQAGTPLY